MNDIVKANIEARKNAILGAYEIKEQDLLDSINDLFNRINELGESCSECGEFESKFASSSLNQEYIDIFTKIVTTCSPITRETETVRVKTTGEEIADEVASELKYQLEDATMPIRRELRQEAYDQVRDIPIVGDALNIKQHVDFFSRFKKKKNEDDEEKN